ncbi:MAG: chemotaxis protein CheW [Pseudomonadales bacterium]|nr:chemotaxis protein CheW [Pseudomonadales bacterium]
MKSAEPHLVFEVSDALFALPLTSLIEVSDRLTVSAMPFAPKFIDGLINHNGHIIPQLNAKAMFEAYLEEQELTGASSNKKKHPSLIIFDYHHSHYALEVDQILESLALTDAEIQPLEQKDGNDQAVTHFITARQNSQQKIHLFNLDFLADIFPKQNLSEAKAASDSKLLSVQDEQVEEIIETELLLFKVDDRLMAINLNDMLEVVDLENIQPIHQSDHDLKLLLRGAGLVRNHPILVVRLNNILNLNAQLEEKQSQSVIILHHPEYYCAIEVSQILSMVTVNQAHIIYDQQIQKAMIDVESFTDLTEILLEQDEQMIELFDRSRFFANQRIQDIAYLMPQQPSDALDVIKSKRLLAFTIEQNQYGIFIDQIERIFARAEIQPLLKNQQFVVGSIDFNGAIIPVIDLQSQLLGEERSDQSAFEVIIVASDKQHWGLALNRTGKIVAIDEADMHALDKQAHLDSVFDYYASHHNQLINILNIDAICRLNQIS